ncbi:hypothetical protein AB4Z48_06170 [Cupriavidus sp. 2TAF22]|uniref:hypothetical protein n=1 Tax=unclassified Cupriavidus TaxID=2640874 RepID=UPI003F92B202
MTLAPYVSALLALPLLGLAGAAHAQPTMPSAASAAVSDAISTAVQRGETPYRMPPTVASEDGESLRVACAGLLQKIRTAQAQQPLVGTRRSIEATPGLTSPSAARESAIHALESDYRARCTTAREGG